MYCKNSTVFTNHNLAIFLQPLSKQPALINDISFWIPDSYNPNDFYDLVREFDGDLVEEVKLIDVYENPKKRGKLSHCYRITYRHPTKTMSQKEMDPIRKKIRAECPQRLGVEMRGP